MKKVILGLIMLTVIAILPSYGQPSEKAAQQIKMILADAPNCFKRFRLNNNVLMPSETHTLYQSSVTVDASTNNVILVDNTVVSFKYGICDYTIHLKEGLNEADANAFIESWKKPLETLLGAKYKMSKSTGHRDNGSEFADGYEFTNSENKETINLTYQQKGMELFEVILTIFKSFE